MRVTDKRLQRTAQSYVMFVWLLVLYVYDNIYIYIHNVLSIFLCVKNNILRNKIMRLTKKNTPDSRGHPVIGLFSRG